MNEFINFGRRSIDLPGGCKDLIDALRAHHRPASGTKLLPAGSFSSIEWYVSRLLQSRATVRNLVIASQDGRATVSLEYGPFIMGYRPAGLSALVFVDDTDPLQEQAVRTVFEEEGISPFVEHGLAGVSGPMWTLRYPLPNSVQEAALLIRTLLRRGFGLNDDAPLWFNNLDRLPPP